MPTCRNGRFYDWLARERGVAAPGSLPASAARPLAWVEELRARLTGHLPLITRGTIAIAGHDWPIASDDAVRDLGYRVTPLEDGLARAWASLRDAAGRG